MQEMKVAILAPFYAFDQCYSLSHVVIDQLNALDSVGVECEMWALHDVSTADSIAEPHVSRIHGVLPRTVEVALIEDAIANRIGEFQPTIVICHDLILQPSYAPYAQATVNLAERYTGLLLWFHYIHSVAGMVPEHLYLLPPTHFITYPSKSLAGSIAAKYDLPADRVLHTPNVHDPRSLWNLHTQSKKMVTELKLMQKDVVQVLPFCATRMRHKGVASTIQVFESLKEMGKSVCLVCVNSSCNAPKEMQAIEQILESTSLVENEDIVFTSRWNTDWNYQTPSQVVNDLFRFSDVFVFLSHGEVCSLSLIEAQLAGCICVINQGTPPLVEYSTSQTIRVRTDSFVRKVTHESRLTKCGTILTGDAAKRQLMYQIAEMLVEKLDASESYQNRKYAFRRFSYEAHGLSLIAAYFDAILCLSPLQHS